VRQHAFVRFEAYVPIDKVGKIKDVIEGASDESRCECGITKMYQRKEKVKDTTGSLFAENHYERVGEDSSAK